jgi:hypothetical protein
MVIVRFTAKWLRTLHQFAAPDPSNGNRQTQFTIEEYVMMPTGAGKAVENSKFVHRLSVRSKAGEHMLPESLVELWRRGRVPAERIPALRKAIEPRLIKEDFDLILHPQSLKNLVIPLIVVFLFMFVFMCFATRSEGHLSLPLALFISAGLTIVTGGLMWMFRQTARKRRAQQMKWLLDAESGVPPEPLPGRTKTRLKRFAFLYALILVLTLMVMGGLFVWLH